MKETPFDRVIKSFPNTRRLPPPALTLSSSFQFDWLQYKNWLTAGTSSTAWSLYLVSLAGEEASDGSILKTHWTQSSVAAHCYKTMVACVAFVAISCEHEGGRSRFESMEDEAVAALSMMPVVKEEGDDGITVGVAADSRVSLKDVERGVERVRRRCMALAEAGVIKGYDGSSFGPCLSDPSTAASLSSHYAGQVAGLLATTSARSFLVDGRTLATQAGRDAIGSAYLEATQGTSGEGVKGGVVLMAFRYGVRAGSCRRGPSLQPEHVFSARRSLLFALAFLTPTTQTYFADSLRSSQALGGERAPSSGSPLSCLSLDRG